jgi:hypothetical protein
MPRIRRRAVGRLDTLSDKARFWLLTGSDLLWFERDCTPADLPELWERFGQEITEDHIREHPGSRPWAWWRWNAPEEPRLLEEGGVTRRSKDSYFPWPADFDPHQRYESQRDYLDRLDLLTDSERMALAAT